jgi:exodeoxyribonuclease VII small subunit
VDLEKSITLYERGAALKAHCEKRLKAAEEKVALITLDQNGQPKGTTPVEGL